VSTLTPLPSTDERNPAMNDPLYSARTDAQLKWRLAEAKRRARTARGPSAAQSADRTAARILAELIRRNAQ